MITATFAILSLLQAPIQNVAPQPLIPPVQSQLVDLGGQVSAVKISADEAGKIALKSNLQLRLARALILSAHGNSIQIESALLPNLDLSASLNNNSSLHDNGINITTNTVTGVVTSLGNSNGNGNSSSVNLTLTQLLFDFGHTVALVRQAKASETALTHALTRSEQDVVYQTKVAFYLFALDLQLISVEESNLKDRQAQLDLAAARVAAGPGEPSDLLVAKTNVADTQQLLIQARATAQVAQIALAITMGIDPRTPIGASDSTEANDDQTFLTCYSQALKLRPDLLQNLELIRSAGFEVQAARSNNAPILNAVAGYSAQGDPDVSQHQALSLGLSLNWSIFDGFNTRGLSIRARADLETARANLANLQLSIGSDVATAWTNLQSALQRLPVTQNEQTLATESLRIASGRFKAGIGAFIAVTDAEASLVIAEQAVVGAKNSIQTARASLHHAIGSTP